MDNHPSLLSMLSILEWFDLFVEHNSRNMSLKITLMPSMDVGFGSFSLSLIGQKIPSPYLNIEQKIPSATFLVETLGPPVPFFSR